MDVWTWLLKCKRTQRAYWFSGDITQINIKIFLNTRETPKLPLVRVRTDTNHTCKKLIQHLRGKFRGIKRLEQQQVVVWPVSSAKERLKIYISVNPQHESWEQN